LFFWGECSIVSRIYWLGLHFKQNWNFVLISLKPVIAFVNVSYFELKFEVFNQFEFFLQSFAQMASGFAVQNQSHHQSPIRLDLKFSQLDEPNASNIELTCLLVAMCDQSYLSIASELIALFDYQYATTSRFLSFFYLNPPTCKFSCDLLDS